MSQDRELGEDFFVGWVRLLGRRRAWAALVFTSVMTLGVALLVLSRPVYRAEARLRLGEPPPMGGVAPNTGILSFFQLGGDPFSNDLELFGSRTLAELLVDELALAVRLDAPRGVHRGDVFASLQASRETAKSTYRVRWVDGGRVQVERTAPRDSTIGAFQAGDAIDFDGVRAVFRPRGEDAPDQIEINTVAFGEAVRTTGNGLSLTRPRREANVLEVTFAHQDPALAETVVRSAVRAFLAMRADLMERESGETVDSLRTVARATQAELRQAELDVETLQRETGLVAPDAQSEALIARYETMLGQLETARAELAALEVQLARVQQAESRVEAWTTLVAHPRFLDNQTMGELLGRLTELQATSTEVSTRRAPGSREVQAVERQITELDGALRTMAGEFRGALVGQVQELSARIDSMDEALARVPEQVIELGRRQRTARVLSELMIITEQRLRQEEIRQALTFSNVQVIDAPALEYRPIWPRTKVGLVVALILAMGSALFAVVVVERADGTVRTERDVQAAGAGPLLAVIVARGGRVPVTADAIDALRHALGSDKGILAPVSGGMDAESMANGFQEAGIEVAAAAPLESYGAAVGAVRAGSQIVLVAHAGRSGRSELARAARQAREAGGNPVGTLLLASSDRVAETAWV